MSIVIRIAKVRASRNNIYFQKIEGYIHSSIGSRSVPVGKQAGRRKRDLIPIC